MQKSKTRWFWTDANAERDNGIGEVVDGTGLRQLWVSQMVACAFGRWDGPSLLSFLNKGRNENIPL